MSQEKNLWRKQPIPNSDRVGFGEVVWQAGAKPDQHVCILYFCIFVLCGIRICLWCGIAGLNLNLMRTYRLWRGTLLENVPHFLIRNLIVGTSLGSRGWSPGKLVKSKGYAKQPPKIKFMIKLCKNQIVSRNLRIVAHWWTLCESHLLRLYYGIFQPSVV